MPGSIVMTRIYSQNLTFFEKKFLEFFKIFHKICVTDTFCLKINGNITFVLINRSH